MIDDKEIVETIRKALITRMGISRQLLNFRINQKKSSFPLIITREDAIILLAIDENISVDSLSKSKLNEINDLIIKAKQYESTNEIKPKQQQIVRSSSRNKEKSKSKPIITIDFNDFKLENSNLPKKRIEEAREMAEFYAYIFIFENSVRQFIIEIMNKKLGNNWWKEGVSNRINKSVESIMKKEKGRWVLREAHPIYYTTMGQLVTIIESNWQDFEDIFGDLQKLKTLIDPIEEARNPIAHNNALTKDQRELLKLNIKMWFNYLNNK